MIQAVTARSDEQVLFDDLSARTDLFWGSMLSQRSLTRSLETSTALSLKDPTVRDELAELFNRAMDEAFEDDTESAFARGLRSIILTHGESAMDALKKIVLSRSVNEGVAAESFEVLGRMNDSMTLISRLWILESGLFSSSARIRERSCTETILYLGFHLTSCKLMPWLI